MTATDVQAQTDRVDGAWFGRGPRTGRAARRGDPRAQLPAARDPGRRRPRRRLARRCPASRPTVAASTIVFCGVHFMAETAKILAPDKTVLIPDARAGCSLADSITADQLRAWKAEHPGAVVVSYVNTTAEVKAETDICCTSSNAVEVVASIPADTRGAVLPDQFLGAHVQRVTGPGQHAHLGGRVPRARRHQRRRADRHRSQAHPDAELFIHPECGCATSALYLAGAGAVPADRVKILSTGGMVDAGQARRTAPTGARRHRDRDAAPAAQGRPGDRLPSRSTTGRRAST